YASDCLIGGTTPAARNIISGNTEGIQSAGTLIEGNYIGTDVTGTVAIGNRILGVRGQTVGGTAPGAGNLISANNIAVEPDLIQGNLIGTDVTGTKALGNATGILGGNVIGGTTAAARNIISGNDVGIFSSGGLIERNYIGTDISGTKAVVGDGDGVWLYGNAT